MAETPSLAFFVLSALALLVTPGPAVLYIVTRSIDQGRVAGFVSSLGIGVGGILQVAAAALGLSAILASSAAAFDLVKYLGAAYLVFLGIRKLIGNRDAEAESSDPPWRSYRRVFLEGVLVNTLNPKSALFFLAFLPQFVDPSAGSAVSQILLLGAIFVSLGIMTDAAWVLLAGTTGAWLRGNLRFQRNQRLFSGGVFIALGIVTALASRQK